MTNTVRPAVLAVLVATGILAGVSSAYVVTEVLRFTTAQERSSLCGERPCVNHVVVRSEPARAE